MNKEIISAAIAARIDRFNRLYKEAVGYTFEEEVEIEKQRYDNDLQQYNEVYKPKMFQRLKDLGYDSEEDYLDYLNTILNNKGYIDKEDGDSVIQECWNNRPKTPTPLYEYEKMVIDQAQSIVDWLIDNYPEKELETWERFSKDKNSIDLVKELEDNGYTGWNNGHSVNSASASILFASTLIKDPEMFPYLHGALSPLVGDDGYHDNREDVHDAIENYKKTHPDFK